MGYPKVRDASGEHDLEPVTVIAYHNGGGKVPGWALLHRGETDNTAPVLYPVPIDEQDDALERSCGGHYITQTELTDNDIVVSAVVAGHKQVLWLHE